MVGRIKIGRTSKDPKANRLRELSADTAAAEPFHLEYYCYVEEYERLETLVHAELAHVRPNKNREFFIITPPEAMLIIQGLASNCGGIKFEESNFSEHFELEKSVAISAEKHGEDENNIENNNTPNLMELYPKAHKVLEYSDTAKELFSELRNLSDSVKEQFLDLLETQPKIPDNTLRAVFEKKFSKVYKHPFEDEYDNHLYGLCLQHSKEMAEEFCEVKEIRGGAIKTTELFEKLSSKYAIPAEIHAMASAEHELSLYLKHSPVDLTSIKLKNLLSEVGLEISKLRGYGYVEYSLSRIMGSRLTHNLTREQFIKFLQYEFDPLKIKDTYIVAPYPDPAGEPVKTRQPDKSSAAKGDIFSAQEKTKATQKPNQKENKSNYLLLWLLLAIIIVYWIIF